MQRLRTQPLSALQGKHSAQQTHTATLLVCSAAVYQGVHRQALVGFKHGDMPQLVKYLAPGLRTAIEALLQHFLSAIPTAVPTAAVVARELFAHFSIVFVPLPSRANRVRERGFNHLVLLLRKAGIVRRNINQVLVAAPGRSGQVGLDAAARQRNAAKLLLHPGRLSALNNKYVILVDDICTTGASLTAACALLQQRGVKVIGAVSLCAAQLQDRSP